LQPSVHLGDLDKSGIAELTKIATQIRQSRLVGAQLAKTRHTSLSQSRDVI
jgi:hypothetical protein